MEIIKQHKEIKEVVVTDERYIQCDKCDKKINVEAFDVFKSNLTIETGSRWPDGSGCGDIESLDLCQECSIELTNLLKTNGYKIQHKEWDD
jgi:hypothetical protein